MGTFIDTLSALAATSDAETQTAVDQLNAAALEMYNAVASGADDSASIKASTVFLNGYNTFAATCGAAGSPAMQ